jgi:hypothetical protein
LRRLIIACGALLALAFIGTSSASAASCTQTTFFRDGHFLTAAVYNAPVVTGEVDATGCDIGVATDGGNQTAVSDADVHSARYFGIATKDADSRTTIDASQVHDIGDTPFDGAQHGVGVQWQDSATGYLADSHVYRYQKNGVTVNGDGTDADVTGSDINGLGPVDFIAQNGVQYSNGASGEVSHNTITDNDYTGCSNQDAAKTGCTPFFSTGLLLFNVDPADVNRFRNLYRDDQRNEVVVPSASL